MVAFGHTAVGVIIGTITYDLSQSGHLNLTTGLLVSGTLGVISHYLTDIIPHGHFFRHHDYRRKVKYAIIFDLLLSIIFFTYLTYSKFGLSAQTWFILFGIGGAQLPDVLDGLYYTGAFKPNFILRLEIALHQSTHWHGKLAKSLKLSKLDIWQLLTVMLAIIILVYR